MANYIANLNSKNGDILFPITVTDAIYSSDQVSLADLFNGKVDKIAGKGLSTNDFTNIEKSKLASIADGANMLTSIYDTNNDGVVDKAASLTGSINQSQVTGLEGALAGKATSAQGSKADTAVQSATIGGATVTKNGTELQLPAYPASLPASDVSAWAKAATKPSYTKGEVGLGNVDNTSDSTKSVASAAKLTTSRTINGVGFDGTSNITVADSTKIPLAQKGVASGVAELDGTGKVPSSQLPSYVDDVLEYANLASFPASGESGKIYIATDTNLTYRWSGSSYVVISSSLALGETSATAYRGDRGKIAYDHSQALHAPADATKNDTDANLRDRATHTGTQSADTITDGISNKVYSAAEKTKLSGIEEGANAYVHPNSGASAGTYKSVTVNSQGHVTNGSNPILAVSEGGTGSTTAAGARANIGAASYSRYTATIGTTWTGTTAPYSQAVSVAGILASDYPDIDIVQSGTETTDAAIREDWGKITRIVTEDGSIVIYASEITTTEIPIQVKVVR